MTTGKTIALTRWTLVGKVMSLLFNTLSKLVISFLPRSKCLFFFNLFNWRLITLQYCIGFAIHQHESAMGVHVFPILNPPFHLPPHTIPPGHPSAPAPNILYPALKVDWLFISYMILYMFQVSFNFMAAVTICSDFGAQKNKV